MEGTPPVPSVVGLIDRRTGADAVVALAVRRLIDDRERTTRPRDGDRRIVAEGTESGDVADGGLDVPLRPASLERYTKPDDADVGIDAVRGSDHGTPMSCWLGGKAWTSLPFWPRCKTAHAVFWCKKRVA